MLDVTILRLSYRSTLVVNHSIIPRYLSFISHYNWKLFWPQGTSLRVYVNPKPSSSEPTVSPGTGASYVGSGFRVQGAGPTSGGAVRRSQPMSSGDLSSAHSAKCARCSDRLSCPLPTCAQGRSPRVSGFYGFFQTLKPLNPAHATSCPPACRAMDLGF